jgi:hypothetical protein
MTPCLRTIGKAKQKSTVKSRKHETCSSPGERVFTDISSIGDGIKVSKPHWCIKVDERTQLKFSSFHEHKDGMVEESCELFYKWKQGGNQVNTFAATMRGKQNPAKESKWIGN